MNLVFSHQARLDLLEISQLIAKDKPGAARKWVREIRTATQKLIPFPYIGRIVPEFQSENIREIIWGSYRIVYKIDKDRETIAILTIHHSKRLLK